MNTTSTHKARKTLGTTLAHAVLRAALMTVSLIGSYALTAQVLPDATMTFPQAVVTEDKPTKAERLVERHGCWTGQAPADMAGKVPGHVVLAKGGYQGPETVRLALEQTFQNADHGLTVVAFCR